jgi:hypothetical protein
MRTKKTYFFWWPDSSVVVPWVVGWKQECVQGRSVFKGAKAHLLKKTIKVKKVGHINGAHFHLQGIKIPSNFGKLIVSFFENFSH